MNKVVARTKVIAISVKNHVKRHKVAYACGSVAVAAVALQQKNRKDFNEFLTKKGIDLEEFYCPEAYAEKLALTQA